MKRRFYILALVFLANPAQAQEALSFGLGGGFAQAGAAPDISAISLPALSLGYEATLSDTWQVSADIGAVFISGISTAPPKKYQYPPQGLAAPAREALGDITSEMQAETRFAPYIKLSVSLQF